MLPDIMFVAQKLFRKIVKKLKNRRVYLTVAENRRSYNFDLKLLFRSSNKLRHYTSPKIVAVWQKRRFLGCRSMTETTVS